MPVVLIVGAAEDVEEDLARALWKKGLETVRAATGAEAESCLARARPDVILVRDPLPDGEATPWIEGLRARGHRVPVVYRSKEAVSAASFERLTRELGVRLVLRDPVVPAPFADQVASLVESPGAGSAAWSSTLGEELAALRREYAATLPGRLGEIHRATRLARAEPDNIDRARRVRELAHGLRGTAGTFGFSKVSEAAGRIEELMNVRLRGEATELEPGFDRIEQALAMARTALEAERPKE